MEDLNKLSDNDLDQVSGGVTMNATRMNEARKRWRDAPTARPGAEDWTTSPKNVVKTPHDPFK